MTEHVEVFADITCPFTHVGLIRVADHLGALAHPVGLRVRAWPLEWVNGSPLAADAVAVKAAALTDELQVEDFAGFRKDTWPKTTVPALALVAAAYRAGEARGTALSLELRRMLFRSGADVSDHELLGETS